MQKPSPRSVILALLALFIISGGAFYFFSSRAGLKAPDAKKLAAAPAKSALTVTIEKPQPVSLPIRLSANGNITAWQEAVIGSESNGLKLTQVLANVGDVVKAGQVLATFSTDSTQADVAQARANVVDAQASALDAAANAERARTLQTSGALSAQQINQYLTLEKTAQAKVEAAQAVLGAQQLKGRQTRVLAPDSGVISARNATVGAVVGSGTELFKMIRKGRLEWRAEVTSAEVARIKPGDKAVVLAASGARVEGRVRIVAPTVNAATRTALVYVDVPANADLKAGMYARGDFSLGASDALTLQQQALVLRDGFTYAMRVEANNKVSQVKLQTGRRVGDAVEILQGAKPGDNFVASGAAFLADGDTVKVVAASPASPASPAPGALSTPGADARTAPKP